MPRIAIKHENTLMYKLVCNDLNITEIYVGSTTNFTVRKDCHKTTCYYEKGKNYNLKVYQYIRSHGGWSNWDMFEIEKFPCVDSKEARKRERFWIETLHAILNCNMPSRSRSEWNHNNYIENKETKLAYAKAHNLVNKERLQENFKCPCGGKYNFEGRSTHFKSLLHLNHIENPELAQIKTDARIYCSCGGQHTKKNKRHHVKTLKHLAYLANIQSQSLAI
jgi:hypothetical protein